MPSAQHEAFRLAIAELSDADLARYLDRVRTEAFQLADMLQRDRAALHGETAIPRPLGKLRLRISRTRARWSECRARQSLVESEMVKRKMFRSGEWDEPTLTDLERLAY